ncbi:MAG: hypothetical protein LBQ96_07670 [Fusobacteriaceae bacterium]|jgi:hypothetical protein|nr:hypothetical protein [Fusobacteriaceae bacterium]
MATKKYVEVTVNYDRNGKKTPILLVFDNRTYGIDKVTDVRRASALKVGGTGIRYSIVVKGHPTYLFEDEGRWFVEANS